MDAATERERWNMTATRAFEVLRPLVRIPREERPITDEEAEAIRVIGRDFWKLNNERIAENNEVNP